MKIKELNKPISRTDNLVMQELDGEMLIYDLKTHKAYSLNHTSNLVYQYCNGEKEISEISLILQKELNKPVNDEVVWLALEGLEKEGLVRFEVPENLKNLNRREVIKRMGLSSIVALPLIVSVVAPTAAYASSVGVACGPGGAVGIGNDPNKTQNGGSCRGNGNCCSNNCCGTAGGSSGICRDVC